MTRWDAGDIPERDEERDRFDLDDRSPLTGLYDLIDMARPDEVACPVRGGVCRLPECRDGCGWADGC